MCRKMKKRMKEEKKLTRKEKIRIAISVVSVVSLIAATIAFLIGSPLYGYILAVSAPICVIALYLNYSPKKNAKVTPMLMLILLTLLTGCF